MRFHADGPSIPDRLLERCDAGRVVFLCGAGVSRNSGMPTFRGLTKFVIDSFSPSEDSQIMRAFKPWLDDALTATVPLDHIFAQLHQEYGQDEVNALVTRRLQFDSTVEKIGYEHGLIKRVSSNRSGAPQIVTTNFDRLFEHKEKREKIALHVPPAFPDLASGIPIEGITYLHGRVASPGASHRPYVLSSADFGRAYLSEAWATKFVRELLAHYTVVLVGYQAEDPPLKYLLQGLNHAGQLNQTQLFAFDKGEPDKITEKWQDRGVTSIAYKEHNHLWQTMEAWADRADKPRKWRRKIIETAKRDPKKMSSYKRGQVAHVLRSNAGARLVVDVSPLLHPEWICVLDSAIRSARKGRGYGDDAEMFDPVLAYGLDDDVELTGSRDKLHSVKNDHLLEWQDGDDNPPDFHKIGNRQSEGRESIPGRLWHLILWIEKLYSSPVIAWWAARQNGLHPRLIERLEWRLHKEVGVHERCRHVWNLVLEFQRNTRNHAPVDSSLYYLKGRINEEGWTQSTVRFFRFACRPRVEIQKPVGLNECKPPMSKWNGLPLDSFGTFYVRYMTPSSESLDASDVTNEVLSTVLEILKDHLTTVAEMLSDIEVMGFISPSCRLEDESDGEEYYDNFRKPFQLMFKLLERLAELNPDLARAHVLTWDEGDKYFFRKLKIYALSMTALFNANDMTHIIASFSEDTIWDRKVVRELMFTLIKHWPTLSGKNKEIIAKRIISGPSKRAHWLDHAFPNPRNQSIAMYGRYLQMNNCELPEKFSAKLDKIIEESPDWNDGMARSIVLKHGVGARFVRTDETPDVLIGSRSSEIVSRAEAVLKREFGSFVRKRPFTGLVKTDPRKALLALTSEARNDSFPDFAWEALIQNFPRDVSPKLYRTFLNRLVRLPHSSLGKIRSIAGSWIKSNLGYILAFDADLGWRVYDHFLNGILASDQEMSESGVGQSKLMNDEAFQKSRRTYEFAIAGPLGKCCQALIQAVPEETQQAGTLIPCYIRKRLEQLLAVTGVGSDHTVSVLLSNLDWVVSVDPVWANEKLIPMLAFDHPASEPAWNGLFRGQDYPSLNVARIIKPRLPNLYPWIERFGWGNGVLAVAARWMAYMYTIRRGDFYGLESWDMRNILRAMSEVSRCYVINWIGQVGRGNVDGWTKLVVPFIESVWPQELRYRSEQSAVHWIRLLDSTKDHFPAVYQVVKRLLIPMEIDSLLLFKIKGEFNGERSIAVRHPEPVLDLMDKLTAEKLSSPSEDLPYILSLIEKADPKLASDSRYLRLIDLVESV